MLYLVHHIAALLHMQTVVFLCVLLLLNCFFFLMEEFAGSVRSKSLRSFEEVDGGDKSGQLICVVV